jgi:malonate-semialdehyde dehydrogenase (acetylating)/methylmalonate-semialdehyde dehydrogenase
MVTRLKYLVGGEWRESATKEWYPITNSSTGEVIAEAPRCTAEEVDGAVSAANEAFGPWRDTPLRGGFR